MYYITSKTDASSTQLAANVARYLKKRSINFAIDENIDISGNKKNLAEIEPDIILAVGDDNVMLRTFRELGKKEIPVLS